MEVFSVWQLDKEHNFYCYERNVHQEYNCVKHEAYYQKHDLTSYAKGMAQ